MSEQQHFYRAYPVVLERSDPRTLVGRLVPYDVSATVVDELPGGQLDVYEEGFRHGAFAPQVAHGRGAAMKVGLTHQHGGGLGYIGAFTMLREASDGLYGEARVMPTAVDNLEALLEEGVRELSVEFRLPRSGDHTVEVGGVRWRTRAHLDQVALEPKGAYSGAEVLAYRQQVTDEQQQAAEQKAREEAERLEAERLAAEEQARKDAEAAEAEAAAQRRAEWDRLTARNDEAARRQEELVREYGITPPRGMGTV